MDSAAYDIHYDIVSVILILMYQGYVPLSYRNIYSFLFFHGQKSARPVRGMNYGVPLGILCGKQKKNPALRDSPPADNPQQRHHSNDLSLLLACLVAHCAGRLTCGLAGRLALAASALLHGILQSLRI